MDGTPNDNAGIQITVSIPGEWIMHPNPNTDLCCLPIGKILNELIVNEKPIVYYTALWTGLIPTKEEMTDFSAMENIIMVGYPNGLSDTYNNKPILRRGITATHIKHDYQNTKTFLIDVACFPGSSGSPVFIFDEGTFLSKGALMAGARAKFIGVLYAGHQIPTNGKIAFTAIPTTPRTITDIPMNLGIAIKAEEILAFEPLLQNLCAKSV